MPIALLIDSHRACPRSDPWLVLLITLAVFSFVLATPFSIVDDQAMLQYNPDFIQPSRDGFWKQLSTPQHTIYAPLTFSLWYLIAAVSSDGTSLPAIGFKLASWIAHGLSATAAWWVIWMLVRRRSAAVLGALIVGLHPLQVESVAWTTGTKDVLCGLFTFVAIALYVRTITGARRRNLHCAVLCGVLAIAAKPTGVVLPAILIAADLAVRKAPVQRRLADLWPFLPASGIGVLVILNVQTAFALERTPVILRPLIALDSYSFYIEKVILPVNLAVDYARSTESVRESGQLAWTWTIPVAALWIAFAYRSRLAWLAVVLFLVPILPVSGIIPFDMQQYTTVTDHYAYQSLLGVGLVVAMLARRNVHAAYTIGAGIAVLAIMSVVQIRLWMDPISLYRRGLDVAPKSLMSRGALVTAALDQGQPVRAERLAREMIAIRPRADAYVNLTIALVAQRRIEEAVQIAKQGLELELAALKLENVQYWLQLAAEVGDSELARLAASRWARLEPANPAPRRLLEQIEAARNRGATSRPASRPAVDE